MQLRETLLDNADLCGRKSYSLDIFLIKLQLFPQTENVLFHMPMLSILTPHICSEQQQLWDICRFYFDPVEPAFRTEEHQDRLPSLDDKSN